jgi:hypothetical protein
MYSIVQKSIVHGFLDEIAIVAVRNNTEVLDVIRKEILQPHLASFTVPPGSICMARKAGHRNYTIARTKSVWVRQCKEQLTLQLYCHQECLTGLSRKNGCRLQADLSRWESSHN